jgi:hypothetical protein
VRSHYTVSVTFVYITGDICNVWKALCLVIRKYFWYLKENKTKKLAIKKVPTKNDTTIKKQQQQGRKLKSDNKKSNYSDI